MSMSLLFYILETIGIISFALSGMMLAKQKDFDPIGWYIIACVTSFGGGTVRDLILDNHPVYWISHWEYPIVILIMTVIFYGFSRVSIPDSWLIVPDALGLALFAVTSAQSAIQMGLPPMIVVIISVMVSNFGGVIRDTLCNDIPMMFRKKVSFYSFAVFLGIFLYLGLWHFGVADYLCMVISAAFICLFRLLSYRYNWHFR